MTYALEGAIFVTGAAVQWLRDGLQIIATAAETEALAATVPDSGGVVFVPALTGLGAPDWDPDARGLIVGITRGTTRAHLARATLEAIAFEVRDVVDLMPREAGCHVPSLQVDGGAAANDLLCQLQADQLGVPVRAAGGPRDDRPGCGVPRRPRHRGVVVDRRAGAHLAAGAPLRADRPRRVGAPAVALCGGTRKGLGRAARIE